MGNKSAIAIHLQDSLNAKQTQIARVLAKHADPKLVLPSRLATEFGSAFASDNLFFADSAEEKPSYIVWNAELATAMADRDFTLTGLLVATESSLVLLGIKSEGVKAIAYKAIKVMAMAAIKKAERKSLFWAADVRRALRVAQMLELTIPYRKGSYVAATIGVTLQDGIPVDDIDQATQISTLMSCDAMSQERAVELQLTDPAAVATELARLAAKRAAQTPSILFNREPGASNAPDAATDALQDNRADGSGADANDREEVALDA